MLSIRPETPDDDDAITRVVTQAFGGMAEARLVQAIRGEVTFSRELSLVAIKSDKLVVHLLFVLIHIEDDRGRSTPAIALAPMAVLPEFQRQGIGSALVQRGLTACLENGHQIVIVLGHADYYPRFGFERASQYGLRAPWDCDDSAFMVKGLTENALKGVSGVVRYPSSFDVVE